jgi:hypothetical protein
MAIDAEDVGELQKALNEASGKASVLWVTFITFELYLAIAFASVTHRALFIEETIKLPVLNVDLPLVGFFIVAPTVLVIFHFYVFLQLLALAQKASDYNELLTNKSLNDNKLVQQRLDCFLVLQFLVGPPKQRKGWIGLCLRLIAWITLVGAPILILLQAQITFLPYHQEPVLWLQRLCILIDPLVIWFCWNPVRSVDDPIIKRVPAWVWNVIGGIATAVVVYFSICIATFTDEHVDGFLTWRQLQTLLFSGSVEEVTGRPRSLFSNRLILTDQSFVDPEKLDKIGISRSFRGRDLRGIVLTRSDLRKADFTGAMLNGAKFNSAKLGDARFRCAETGVQNTSLLWPDDGCAWLQDASFAEANLQAVDFERARLGGLMSAKPPPKVPTLPTRAYTGRTLSGPIYLLRTLKWQFSRGLILKERSFRLPISYKRGPKAPNSIDPTFKVQRPRMQGCRWRFSRVPRFGGSEVPRTRVRSRTPTCQGWILPQRRGGKAILSSHRLPLGSTETSWRF